MYKAVPYSFGVILWVKLAHGTPEPSVGKKKLPSVMKYIIVFVKR